jgi:N-carbamoyl-L-amino-acid hydrolase
MVVAAEQLAKDYGGLATIGRMGSQAPQSTNCILDDVEFHLDIRHHDDAKLDQLEKAIRDRFAAIVTESRGVDMVRFGALTASASTKFDPKAVACVAKACKQWSQSPIISGAGHDS